MDNQDSQINKSAQKHSGIIEPLLSEKKDDVGIISPHDERNINKKRKIGVFLSRFIRILTIKFVALLTLILFLTFFGVSYAQAPIHALVDQITKPKPIIQSSTVLPSNIQQAIELKAQQQITQEKAIALVATNTASPTTQSPSLLSNVIYPFQVAFTTSPADKAKLRLKHIDQQIQQLRLLLQSDSSDNAVNQAVDIIQNIGRETGQIVADKSVQTNHEILTLQIEQYTRLQLLLQKLEDTLPVDAYLKINDAREKYLVSGAKEAINAAPNLGVINAIGIGETRKIVGNDFAELKAIETLTDINNNGLNSQAQQNLSGVQKELVLQFEKRMLILPADVRTRKLQNYISLSYGNPLNQVESFNQMQHLLTDRDMILNVESLKELALKKLEARIFEIKTKSTRDQFIKSTFNTPQSLEVLGQVQLDASTLTNTREKKQITDLEADAQSTIIQTFGSAKSLDAFFAPELSETTNLLDAAFVSRLDTTLQNSSTVNPEVKTSMHAIAQKVLHNFVAGIVKNNFLTTSKSGYNPVAENADVRLLVPAPYAIPLLEEVRGQLSGNDKTAIGIAQKAESGILATHLLTQVNNATIFEQYQQYIANTPQVKQTLNSYIPQGFYTTLDQKKIFLAKQSKADQQILYEKMQQILQQIFLSRNTIVNETSLPTQIQQEIAVVKQELSGNSVPILTIPAGVKLSEVATLPQDVQNALIDTAKNQIAEKNISENLKTDLAQEAKSLGVSVPTILPDSIFYPVLEIVRKVELAVQFDPISQAELLVKQDTQKTLEAAVLVENNKSTEAVSTAIKTLDSVAADFDLLAQKASENKTTVQSDSTRVNDLVNEIIDTGVARQTILSEVEGMLHGNDFVAVEAVRSDELKDGTNALLSLTNNNVPELTSKLEAAVNTGSNTIVDDIKAVDLLNEIARSQPENVQTVLQNSEASIVGNLENSLSSLTPEQKIEVITAYADNATGNPVRTFEAVEILKDDLSKPADILLIDKIENIAAQNLEARISEIPDATSEKQFTDTVVGGEPQDLKIVTEIADRVAPPQNAGVVETLPIVQKVEDIKADIEQNIVDTYKANPDALKNADLFDNPALVKTPDVVDIQVAEDLHTILSQTSDATPQVVEVAKNEEAKIINTFVDNVASPQFHVSAQTSESIHASNQTISAEANISALAAQTLSSVPDTLQILIDLKSEVAPQEAAKIESAIITEVHIIQATLSQTNDPITVETYVSQIQNNSEVAAVVTQIGGQSLQETIQQVTEAAQMQASTDENQLQTTVEQVQQEVFSAPVSSPTTVEQSLPQPIQQEIQQIKQEVPTEQIPSVNVATETSVSTTAIAQPVDTTPVVAPAPVAPVQSTPATQSEQSAPSAPASTAPATESKPADNPAPASNAVPQAPAVEAPAVGL